MNEIKVYQHLKEKGPQSPGPRVATWGWEFAALAQGQIQQADFQGHLLDQEAPRVPQAKLAMHTAGSRVSRQGPE